MRSQITFVTNILNFQWISSPQNNPLKIYKQSPDMRRKENHYTYADCLKASFWQFVNLLYIAWTRTHLKLKITLQPFPSSVTQRQHLFLGRRKIAFFFVLFCLNVQSLKKKILISCLNQVELDVILQYQFVRGQKICMFDTPMQFSELHQTRPWPLNYFE